MPQQNGIPITILIYAHVPPGHRLEVRVDRFLHHLPHLPITALFTRGTRQTARAKVGRALAWTGPMCDDACMRVFYTILIPGI